MFRHIISLIAASLFATEAAAYTYNTCLGENLTWDDDVVTLRANTSSAWYDALATAVGRFNQNPSRFRYSLTSESGRVGPDNGENEIWLSSDRELVTGLAVTIRRYTCFWFFGNHVHLDEIDIVFSDSEVFFGYPQGWVLSESKDQLVDYGGGGLSAPMVAVHELGHGIGLNHETDEYNAMGNGEEHLHVNGSLARAYFGEDASAGAMFLCGVASPVIRDVGVVHWRHNGIANHVKTILRQADGGTLDSFSDNEERRWYVAPGQQIRIEFTYENNGATTEYNVPIGFYISRNDTVSIFDTRIGDTTVSLNPNSVYTTQHTITIPSSTASGNYWLGPVIDEQGTIPEIAEWNNATYLPIHVCLPYLVCLTATPPPPIVF